MVTIDTTGQRRKAFDYMLTWAEEQRMGYGAFSVAVMPAQWESDWEGYAERFMRDGAV